MTERRGRIRGTLLVAMLVRLVATVAAQTPNPVRSAAAHGSSPAEKVADQTSGVVGTLPGDYREQIVRFELKQHADFRDLEIEYADPVRVLVHAKDASGPGKPMTAVVFSYTPRSPDGLMYFMVVQGAVLFEAGALKQMIRLDDPMIEWVDGQPRPHAATAEGRKQEIQARVSRATRQHDPANWPREKREIRRRLWTLYHPAMIEMRMPAEKAAQLEDLLVAREERPSEVDFLAIQRGDDPFSAAVRKAVGEAKDRAQRALSSFLGEQDLDRLEFLAGAISSEGSIRKEEGLELADAGIPLSPEQLLGLAEIVNEVRNYERNPAYREQSQLHDPTTGLSGLDEAILERSAAVLTAEQLEVVRAFMIDRVMYTHAPRGPEGRDSAWLLHEPVYGPNYRRQIRRWVLKDYFAPVADLSLPGTTAAEVTDLLVRRNLAPREAAYDAEEKGLDRAAKGRAVNAAMAKTDQELKAFLGESNYQRLEGFKLFESNRQSVERGEAAELELAGCPLTADQLRAVEEAYWKIHTVETPGFKALQARPADPDSGLTAVDVAYLDGIEPLLTPQQLAVVRTYRMDFAAVMRGIEEKQPKR